MPERKARKTIRGLATSPLVDCHIAIPEDVLNKLDAMKEELHVSRSVVIAELIKNEYEAQRE